MARPRPVWTPPLRDGVAASRVAVPAGPWATVAEFLAQRLRAGQDWPARMARGEVLDARGRPLLPDARCVPGSVLWYWREPDAEHPLPEDLVVLHQDAHLVAIDKPHFMAAIPGGRHLRQTALVRLRQRLGIETLVPMHRLDRETAGVLLFVVQPAQRQAYQALLRERRVHKVYEAVAPWQPGLALPLDHASRLEEPLGRGFMQMQVQPGPPNAFTQVELLRRLGPLPAAWAGWVDSWAAASAGGPAPALPPRPSELAHYRLLPLTGRKHQLRVHMLELGLPILGDRIYPRLWPEPAADAPPDWRWPLQLLAREIRFTDPVTGEERCFRSQRTLALADAAAAPAA